MLLLRSIGLKVPSKASDPWIAWYIFPNSRLGDIVKAVEGRFVIEDWQNFGAHYDNTLLEGHRRFEESWDRVQHQYGHRFYRMWRYYLLSCAGAFRARTNQLWQIVLRPQALSAGPPSSASKSSTVVSRPHPGRLGYQSPLPIPSEAGFRRASQVRAPSVRDRTDAAYAPILAFSMGAAPATFRQPAPTV